LGVAVLAYTPLFGRFPFEVPVYTTLDFTPWFNNLGWALLGVYGYSLGIHRYRSPAVEGLVFQRLGKYSLEIYLGHQAILLPLVLGIVYILDQ